MYVFIVVVLSLLPQHNLEEFSRYSQINFENTRNYLKIYIYISYTL